MAFDRPVRHACATCGARDRSDFEALDAPEAAVLDRVKSRRRLAPGEALFRQGEPYTAVYCVAEGLIGRRLLHENGASVLVGLARPGDMLGACGLLAGGPHATTAEALADSAVCVVRGSDAARLAAAQPAFRQRLVERCVAAIGAAERAVLEATALPAFSRFCTLLVDLLAAGGVDDGAGGRATTLPISRGDMAALLGVQPESLSRLIRRGTEEGLIAFAGRRLSAPSMAALRAAAATTRRSGEG
jgi:CRP-like cAMP-binding protein